MRQLAEKNPQKLRQVGMQYDLAHAKGGISDEDLKIEALKAKEKQKAIDRKKKEKSEKVSVELKIDIERPSKSEAAQGAKDEVPPQEGEVEQFEDAAERIDRVASENPAGKTGSGPQKDLSIRPKGHSALSASNEGEAAGVKGDNDKIEDIKSERTNQSGEKSHEKDMEKSDTARDKKEGRKEKKDAADEDDGSGSSSDESSDSEDDETRWNAVCVTCLRIYSKDEDLCISLVKPEDAEEASSLVQGQEPTGATM